MSNLSERDLSGFSDEKLVLLSDQDDSLAFATLVSRYLPFVRVCASGVHCTGLETEDLAQEGVIGLIRAIRTYSANRGASFHTYAVRCIENSISSVIRSACSVGKVPPNITVSIDSSDEYGMPLPSPPAEDIQSPESIVLSREGVRMIGEQAQILLSDLEHRVLLLFLEGFEYTKIANELGISVKSVDNALSRIRKKLKSN